MVDPALAENEHHGQLHADQQAQQQPHRVTLQQRQQAHRKGAGEQAQAHQRRRPEACSETAGDHRAKQNTHRRRRRHHTDGEVAVAPAFQAQRHQRHGQAEGQADADDRQAYREIGAPTHCRSPVPSGAHAGLVTSTVRNAKRPGPEGNPAADLARRLVLSASEAQHLPGMATLGFAALSANLRHLRA
ncbi:hypothetical protein D3C76_1251650 [compost metagenome]